MNRGVFVLMMFICGALVGGLVVIGTVKVSSRMAPQISEVKSGSADSITIEAPVNKREVVQKSDCSRVKAVRAFETKRRGWYENRVVLENGRIEVLNSLFIYQVGELPFNLFIQYF